MTGAILTARLAQKLSLALHNLQITTKILTCASTTSAIKRLFAYMKYRKSFEGQKKEGVSLFFRVHCFYSEHWMQARSSISSSSSSAAKRSCQVTTLILASFF
jgi:hypothetical protein